MATAKERGAPASASKRVGRKDGKLTRKEKSAINSARFREAQAKELARIKAAKPVIVPKPKKPRFTDPGLALHREPGQVGRPPVEYTPELAEKLFDYIVSGLSLEKIGRIEGMPSMGLLLKWVGRKDHPFSSDYARAKQLLVPLYEEQARDAALDTLPGTITVQRTGIGPKGERIDIEEVRTIDNVERSKLIVGVNQWALSWMMPKKHGRLAQISDNEPNAQLAALFESLKAGPVEPEK